MQSLWCVLFLYCSAGAAHAVSLVCMFFCIVVLARLMQSLWCVWFLFCSAGAAHAIALVCMVFVL